MNRSYTRTAAHTLLDAALLDAAQALRDGQLRGAVLDVWWQYPTLEKKETWPSKFPFHELSNVVMTPHCSGWTAERVPGGSQPDLHSPNAPAF